MKKKIPKKKLLKIVIMIMILFLTEMFCMKNNKNAFAMNQFNLSIMQTQVDVETTSEVQEDNSSDEIIKKDKITENSSKEETAEVSQSKATVIEHMITDKNGKEIENSKIEEAEKGKEFYTIQTDTEKIFYLIVDKDGTQEDVYFLTQISEDDLMDVASEGNGTYQTNSNTVDFAIPNHNTLLPNESNPLTENTIQESQDITQKLENENTEQIETNESNVGQEENPMAAYIFYGVIAILTVGIGYYLKVYRKKKENFVDDEEDEEVEEWETEKETDNEEDDFLNQTETEEE